MSKRELWSWDQIMTMTVWRVVDQHDTCLFKYKGDVLASIEMTWSKVRNTIEVEEHPDKIIVWQASNYDDTKFPALEAEPIMLGQILYDKPTLI